MLAIIKNLGILNVLKNLLQILNNIPFLFYAILYIVFILFNTTEFSQTGSQAESLKWTITSLFLFWLAVFSFASLRNKSGVIKSLNDNKGIISIFSFFLFLFVFGVIFASSQGKINLIVDNNFISGLFLNTFFLFNYMFIVAIFEESIFRDGFIEYFKSKSGNLTAVYILSALIFAFYHYFRYNGNLMLLFVAFLAGLGFTWIKVSEDIFGFDTFPISIALHLVFNLFVVNGLKIVLSMFGVTF